MLKLVLCILNTKYVHVCKELTTSSALATELCHLAAVSPCDLMAFLSIHLLTPLTCYTGQQCLSNSRQTVCSEEGHEATQQSSATSD